MPGGGGICQGTTCMAGVAGTGKLAYPVAVFNSQHAEQLRAQGLLSSLGS
jgi:hypothetical protein